MVCEAKRPSQRPSLTGSLNPCFSGIWSVRDFQDVEDASFLVSLNPCFSGIWSVSGELNGMVKIQRPGLNPCFSGIWSVRRRQIDTATRWQMRLNPCFSGIWSVSRRWWPGTSRLYTVLILVLVEYGLWGISRITVDIPTAGLNPCFSGIWSVRTWTLYSISPNSWRS